MSQAERIFQKVRILQGLFDCWLWAGATNSKGYGYAWTSATESEKGKGHAEPVHRIVYRLFVGAIPEGYEVDHTCEVPLCVNPTHLQVVRPEENMRYRWYGHTVVPLKRPRQREERYTDAELDANDSQVGYAGF